MSETLFVAAQLLFAVLPIVGLVERARHPRPSLSAYRLTNQLASVSAFALLTALFVGRGAWLESGLVGTNLALRLVEAALWWTTGQSSST